MKVLGHGLLAISLGLLATVGVVLAIAWFLLVPLVNIYVMTDQGGGWPYSAHPSSTERWVALGALLGWVFINASVWIGSLLADERSIAKSDERWLQIMKMREPATWAADADEFRPKPQL